MTDTVLEDAGFEFDFTDITPETVEAVPGPLTGSRGTRPGAQRRAQRRSSGKKLDSLQKKLSGEMFSAGAMIGMGLHTTGLYICQESDTFTKAVIELAATRPEWVAALENVANLQPGLVIGRTALGLGAAFAVDRGRLDPEKQFAKFLGVYSAWKQHADPDNAQRVEGSAYVEPPAGSFVPLG